MYHLKHTEMRCKNNAIKIV